MDFDDTKIPTKNLRKSDVPRPSGEWISVRDGVEDWSLVNFALSFDGYEFMQSGPDEAYFELTSAISKVFETSPQVLKCFNTTGPRCLLFMEQRKAKWAETNRTSPYVIALLDAIRARLG